MRLTSAPEKKALHMQCLFRENARKSNIHWERYLQNLRFPIHSHQVHIRRSFSALPLMYWKVNITRKHDYYINVILTIILQVNIQSGSYSTPISYIQDGVFYIKNHIIIIS